MAQTRRVRVVCISDTHNQTPKLPSGDILIHAGDLTNQGTFSELEKTVQWLKQTPFKVKIIICGNHDVTCDLPFYQQHGGTFHNKRLQDPQKCISLLHSDPTFVYLKHEAKVVHIKLEEDTCATIKVFGSPYSPAKGFWAFGYRPEEAFQLWQAIPFDADIVVTHTPAQFHRDKCGTRGFAGCAQLRTRLSQVRPRLVVCGHIHEGYGVETITWDLSSGNGQYRESSVHTWDDPAPQSKKQFVVDVSSRSRSSALRNDGSLCPDIMQPESSTICDAFLGIESITAKSSTSTSEAFPRPVSVGRREGRSQTCIVNAAFMANNWPHNGGKRFHKPIVIDLDLPIIHYEPQPSPASGASATPG